MVVGLFHMAWMCLMPLNCPLKDGVFHVRHLWLRQERIRLQCGRPGFDPWVGKIPWRRAWQPAPVFWPGEPRGQRSLGATVHGVAESDMTRTFTFHHVK